MVIKKEPLKNSEGKSQILIIIIILVVILGIAVYFFINSQSSKQGGMTDVPSTSKTETTTEGEPLPEKDAVGTKDLDIIGRYPGSVRTMYEDVSDSNYKSVTYVTKAQIDDVKEYYLNQLQEEGWELVSSSEDELRFEKEPSTFRIHFYYDEQDKILKYSLEYTSDTDY